MTVARRLAGALMLGATAVAAQTPAQRMEREVRYLASDGLGGRFTGTPGADAAAAFLVKEWSSLGVKPGVPGWRQRFVIAPDAPGLKDWPVEKRPAGGTNVVGLIPGRDPALRDQVVIVGAHYDHLGGGEASALDPDHRGEVHHGADDNASGTAALIEIARRLVRQPPRRSVLLVAFAGEELGLLGSAAYVKSPAVPLGQSYAMINLDMVGRLRDDRLLVFGTATAEEFPGLLDSLNQAGRFDLRGSGDGYGRSDQQSFYVAGLPVLHLFTDLHEDYHRASDDWSKLNYPGLVRVAEFAARTARALGDRPEALHFVSAPPPVAAQGPAAGSGYGAYLGTIPDMSGGVAGVRLSGVRPGSPAEQAGLKAGDILLRMGGREVADLQAMTEVLRNHQPGDQIVVGYRRGEAADSVRVVLGKRGG